MRKFNPDTMVPTTQREYRIYLAAFDASVASYRAKTPAQVKRDKAARAKHAAA